MNAPIEKSISNVMLFLIGISAGVIASFFPRLLPFLSSTDQSVTITLFTLNFFFGASAFSLMIGVSMIWLYMGTKEHTKNLFMSALALPAVLSGGVSMSTFTSTAERKISDLNNQTIKLQKELKKQKDIKIKELDLNGLEPLTLQQILGSFSIISSAHAESSIGALAPQDNSSVRISVDSLEKKFVIMLGTSKNLQSIEKQKTKIDNYGIHNIKTYEIGNSYYLLESERKTKSEALLNAIEFQEKYKLNPVLIQAK